MKKKSLFRKLLGTYVLLTFLGLGIVSFFFYVLFSHYYYGVKEQQLLTQGQEMAEVLSPYLRNQGYGQIDEVVNAFNKVNIPRMWVVDKNGTLIGGRADLSPIDELCLDREQLGKALQGEVVSKQGKVTNETEPVLSVAVPVYVNDKVDGAIYVCNPLAEITASIAQTLKIVLLAGLFGVGIVAFVSYFVSRSITRPIKQMTKISLQMARGDFSQRACVCSSDEVGELSENFNYMVGKLDKTLRDLEEEKNKTAEMERMQREFVANASHELRTPLTSMRGFVEAILDGVVTGREQQIKYLKIILKETIRLHRLVNSLLDLSRLESGLVKVELRELELAPIIERTVAKIAPLSMDKKLDLKQQVADDLPLVMGDEDLVEQVLINFITNAIRFTPTWGKIAVIVERSVDEVCVHVSDTGIGIPPAELPNIWNRFYKVTEARALSKEGSGLGLALVKEIIDQLGGRVWIVSTVGQGSVFSFCLPIKKVHK